MDLLEDNWLSVEGNDEANFNLIVNCLLNHYLSSQDIVTFDRTFAEEESISKIQLNVAKTEEFNSKFYAAVDRYWRIVGATFVHSLLEKSQEFWSQQGFENLSLFRSSVCYLETLTHHNTIFIRSNTVDLKKQLPPSCNCRIFRVD